mgnify:CR=1 FL=1
MKTITFTGHRPNKIYGYDLKNPKYLTLSKKLESILEEEIKNGYTNFIVGGALGFDTVAFLTLKNLRTKYSIKITIAVPFEEQYISWSDKDIRLYHWMKSIADKVVFVDTIEGYNRTSVKAGKFHKEKLKIRNEFMVENSDYLISLWDGDYKSGTAHCINYAKKHLNGPIINIDPKTLNLTKIK